ncbi:hypothetical protein J6590_023636 [Homalodisca vitripennis]|nr:hypothetical protein J6590_023636 [Homalodisca vitripennis]
MRPSITTAGSPADRPVLWARPVLPLYGDRSVTWLFLPLSADNDHARYGCSNASESKSFTDAVRIDLTNYSTLEAPGIIDAAAGVRCRAVWANAVLPYSRCSKRQHRRTCQGRRRRDNTVTVRAPRPARSMTLGCMLVLNLWRPQCRVHPFKKAMALNSLQ